MRRATTFLSTLLLAVMLFAVPGALSPAQAQNPIQADGQNPMGARPTADSVNEEFLFKQRKFPDAHAAYLCIQAIRPETITEAFGCHCCCWRWSAES